MVKLIVFLFVLACKKNIYLSNYSTQGSPPNLDNTKFVVEPPIQNPSPLPPILVNNFHPRLDWPISKFTSAQTSMILPQIWMQESNSYMLDHQLTFAMDLYRCFSKTLNEPNGHGALRVERFPGLVALPALQGVEFPNPSSSLDEFVSYGTNSTSVVWNNFTFGAIRLPNLQSLRSEFQCRLCAW